VKDVFVMKYLKRLKILGCRSRYKSGGVGIDVEAEEAPRAFEE
jgi:hypothetical protein